ncbi:hypothetical protein D3C78_1913410 [compost metagenome]
MHVHPAEFDRVRVAVQAAAADDSIARNRDEQLILARIPRHEAERGVDGVNLGAVTFRGLPQFVADSNWVHG